MYLSYHQNCIKTVQVGSCNTSVYLQRDVLMEKALIHAVLAGCLSPNYSSRHYTRSSCMASAQSPHFMMQGEEKAIRLQTILSIGVLRLAYFTAQVPRKLIKCLHYFSIPQHYGEILKYIFEKTVWSQEGITFFPCNLRVTHPLFLCLYGSDDKYS